MTTLLTAIGLLIAGFGALIAYFQWRTAHQRIVLDLFERRTEVFEEIENAVKQALNSSTREEADAAFWRFVSAESESRFCLVSRLSKNSKQGARRSFRN